MQLVVSIEGYWSLRRVTSFDSFHGLRIPLWCGHRPGTDGTFEARCFAAGGPWAMRVLEAFQEVVPLEHELSTVRVPGKFES